MALLHEHTHEGDDLCDEDRQFLFEVFEDGRAAQAAERGVVVAALALAEDELVFFVDDDDVAAATRLLEAKDASLESLGAAIDVLGGFRGARARAADRAASASPLARATARRAALALAAQRPRTAVADAVRSLLLARAPTAEVWLTLSRALLSVGSLEAARTAAARGRLRSAPGGLEGRALDDAWERADAAVDAARSRATGGTSGPVTIAGLGLTVERSSAASTGGVIWDACLILSHWLAANPARATNKTVLELGAGVGVVGLSCAKLMASRVTLTDCDPQVVSVLRANALSNGLGVDVERLDFTDGRSRSGRRFDVVLGSEIIYSTGVAEPLADCLDTRLSRDGTAVFIVGRGRPGVAETVDAARALDFDAFVFPPPEAAIRAAREHEPRTAHRLDYDMIVLRRTMRASASEDPVYIPRAHLCL